MAKVWKYEFDPVGWAGIKRLPRGVDRDAMLEEIADFVKESILKDVGGQRSPVTGRQFKLLNKDYAKVKREDFGAPGIPNLELTGDMLDSLEVQVVRGNKLRVWVDDASQQDKVAGHHHFLPGSNLPKRPFIPEEDGKYRPEIRAGVAKIVKRYVGDAEDGE